MVNDLFSLKGKVIVITGAAGLLGKMHSDAIAMYGGHPVLLDLNQESVDQVSNELKKKYKTNSLALSVDITNETQVEKI